MSDDDKLLDQPPCVAWMMTRRRFLSGMAMSAAMAPLVQACEFAEIFDDDVQTSVDFDVNAAGFEKLATVGGFGQVSAGAIDILLIREAAGSILAFDRKCPHANLDMADDGKNTAPAVWDAEAKQLTCRWHNSVFSVDGDVVDGPSMSPLRRYRVEFEEATGLGTVFLIGAATSSDQGQA